MNLNLGSINAQQNKSPLFNISKKHIGPQNKINRTIYMKHQNNPPVKDYGDFNKIKKIKDTVNCYAYALNMKVHPVTGRHFSELTDSGFGLQPGRLMKPIIPNAIMIPLKFINNFTVEKISGYIQKDVENIGGKLTPAKFDTPTPKGSIKIALAVHKYKDYHFYRLDEDGTWSHKLGTKEVTNVDSIGNIILDPQKASRNYKDANYTDFGGYFIYTPPK